MRVLVLGGTGLISTRDLGFKCTVDWSSGIARGLRDRVPRPVDPGERDTYEAIVDSWLRATSRMRDELVPRDL
jgi:hypothetical protein